MSTKHTPAPWEYQGGDNASVEVNIGETTANIDRQDKNTGQYVISREEMEANAKLIAAAPELLEALEELMKVYERNGQLLSFDVNIARNAIKKATE